MLATDVGTYSVVVTNSAGSATSNGVALKVPPRVTTQPLDQAVTTGHTATLEAAADIGTKKWQVSSDGGTTWADVADGSTYAGSATGTLKISGATEAMNGYQYRLSSNNAGTITTSDPAMLTVNAALFPSPVAIAVGPFGVLYVGDATTNTVQKVAANGTVSKWVGAAGSAGSIDGTGTAALFNQPGGVVVLASGVAFVADTANSTIRRIAVDGAVTTFAGSASARGNANGTGSGATFSNPIGIAADAAGNLFVADTGNHTIRKITPAGAVTTFAGGAGALGTSDGTGTAARFNAPAGVAVDGAGNVFVADTTNNTIRKITPAGVVTTLAGLAGVSGATDGTGAAALFNHPAGIAADAGGFVYVADTGNSAIRRISPVGAVTTLAGLATIAGLQDGTGGGAWFNQPKGLALDNVGNLFVADTGNAALRKVSSSGIVTTLSVAAEITVVTPAMVSSGGSGGTSGGGSSSGGGGATGGGLFAALAVLTLARVFRTARWHATSGRVS